jgi:hypothetical protein
MSKITRNVVRTNRGIRTTSTLNFRTAGISSVTICLVERIMMALQNAGSPDEQVCDHVAAFLILKPREKHNHRARLGPVDIPRNRLYRLPLDDVVRGVEGRVNPASPWIFACAI